MSKTPQALIDTIVANRRSLTGEELYRYLADLVDLAKQEGFNEGHKAGTLLMVQLHGPVPDP